MIDYMIAKYDSKTYIHLQVEFIKTNSSFEVGFDYSLTFYYIYDKDTFINEYAFASRIVVLNIFIDLE